MNKLDWLKGFNIFLVFWEILGIIFMYICIFFGDMRVMSKIVNVGCEDILNNIMMKIVK